MDRRRLLHYGCAQCALLAAATPGRAWAGLAADWSPPPRFTAPDPATDEGGLWAMIAREETKLRRGQLLIRDTALREYLKSVMCRLAGDHCPDMRVYPVRTPWFNASMAPNGMMQVWSGLLLRVDNEAQLAAVLGHEIGHYLQRHTLQMLQDARRRSGFATFMIPLGLGGAVASMIAVAGSYSFSRDNEREADQIGVILMKRAGYDPREASTVWANLMAEVGVHPDANLSTHSPMFATHPASAERRETLAKLAGDGGGQAFEAEFQAQVAPLQKELLEDELQRAEYDESIVLLERLTKRSPDRADLLYYRGEARRLRAQKDDLDVALADLNAAAAMPGAPAQVQRGLGFILQGRGDKPGARQAFTKYLELEPGAMDASMIQSYLSELGT